MAAAEARAAWQRTANRYFVQEDAKRAPKLACGPSSSSKPQVDMGPNDAPNAMGQGSAGFVPYNWNTSNSNLPADTKWWLQLQPSYGHQKDFSSDQLNLLEMELESLRNAESKKMSNLSEDTPASEEVLSCMSTTGNAISSPGSHHSVPATCMKDESETISVSREVTQKTFPQKKTEEYWFKDEEFTDIDPINSFISKKPEKLFDMESPWMTSEKTEPWWRTADRDALASLVARKSLEHVENCDLPPPQTKHVRTGPFACLESFDQDGIFTCDRKGLSGLCSAVDHSWGCLTCGSPVRKHQVSGERVSSYGFDKSLSTDNSNAYKKDSPEARRIPETEPSKAELMEALRHSQTRAREAESAAQKAYDEKEHIIKLFFKQASHLFAYKQWLQLLQLESILLQLKNKDQSISTIFPTFLPWMPCRGRQAKKGKPKKKAKRSQPRFAFCKCAVAFAVGLGLAGAGLLLGWTMGWLFPMF